MRTLFFYTQLLPTSVMSALLMTLAVSVSALVSRSELARRDTIASHAGCWLGMPIALIGCAALGASWATDSGIALMFGLDFLIALAIAITLSFFLRQKRDAPRAGVEPATPRLGGECSIH